MEVKLKEGTLLLTNHVQKKKAAEADLRKEASVVAEAAATKKAAEAVVDIAAATVAAVDTIAAVAAVDTEITINQKYKHCILVLFFEQDFFLRNMFCKSIKN